MTCNGYVYRMGAALLDINEPWKVLARGKVTSWPRICLTECMGDVPNVTFPLRGAWPTQTPAASPSTTAAPDNRHRPGFTTVDRVLDYIKANSF